MDTHGHLLIRVGVLASTCMAASRHLHSWTPPTEPACGRERDNPLSTCLAGDAWVTEAHLVDPFVIAFAAMLVMNAPTLLLTHTRKLEGVKFLCATGLVLLGGLGISLVGDGRGYPAQGCPSPHSEHGGVGLHQRGVRYALWGCSAHTAQNQQE